MQAGSELRELDAAGFRAELDALLSIYASAMHASPLVLPGRRSIMERHAEHPSFRAVAVYGGLPQAGTSPAGTSGAGTREPGPATADGATHGQIIAFTYGFHGAAGQWWHDLVWNALTEASGERVADEWMTDSFEVAEVHVHPDRQRQGIGTRMLLRLLAHRPERTALLSTMDADTTARRLYRRLGFADLLTAFHFAGTEPPYAVMGATLPLIPQPAPTAPAVAPPGTPPPATRPPARPPRATP